MSIGTGVPSLTSYGSSLLEIGKTLQQRRNKQQRLFITHSDLDDGNRYFRFNVSHGLKSIGLEDATQKNKIMAATTRYAASESVMKQMKLCGNKLSTRECASRFA